MMSYLHVYTGAAWVFLVFTAVCTVGAKLWLRRRISQLEAPQDFHGWDVTAALLLPAFFPLMWLVSGVAHLGGGGLGAICRSWLWQPGNSWSQFVFFAAPVGLLVVHFSAAYRRWTTGHATHDATVSDDMRKRLERICETDPRLSELSSRLRVVECDNGFCAVRGYISPDVEIAAGLVERLDDEALRAALLHEAAHVRHGDPLRSLAEMLARVVNPFSRWLGREYRAWRFAREVQCDRAVLDAGMPGVHLADALVTSARAHVETRGRAVHLCGESTSECEARVNLILHASVESDHQCRTNDLGAMLAPLLLALLAPHALGGALLQSHALVEHLFM